MREWQRDLRAEAVLRRPLRHHTFARGAPRLLPVPVCSFFLCPQRAVPLAACGVVRGARGAVRVRAVSREAQSGVNHDRVLLSREDEAVSDGERQER